MSTEDLKEQIRQQTEKLETLRLRNELRRLKLVERAERTDLRKLEAAERAKRADLRKLEAAERAKRTGLISIEALREQITHGLLKGERGVNSSRLAGASYAWRRLIVMLRQPADSPARLEAEGLLRQLHVTYDDGNDFGKGLKRQFWYEPPAKPGEVKLW